SLNADYHVLTGNDLPDLRKDKAVFALPLVLWLRHPAMPMAALMPMTRSASSAVRPLESRDLFPLIVDAPAQAFGVQPLVLAWKLLGAVFPEVGLADGPPVKLASGWPWPADPFSGIALAAFGVPGTELRLADPSTAYPLAVFWTKLDFALRFD